MLKYYLRFGILPTHSMICFDLLRWPAKPKQDKPEEQKVIQ